MDAVVEDNEKDRHVSDVHRQKRGKNIAVALTILGFCVIVYLVSIIKIGSLIG